jgi:L-ascorbate metabolism protein UlaG (beta-lactamase superfamily)
MEITWFGNSCFRMTERGVATIITDPYESGADLALPRKDADVVTVSTDDPEHNNLRGVKAGYKALTGPGEYEIGGVFITGIDIRPDRKKQVDGRPRTTVFVFEFEGVTVCHLGTLGHVPTQAQVEDLGAIGVLLVPVGGAGGLNASQAAEVVSLLEPSLVVPMQFGLRGSQGKLDSVSKFLKEMGLAELEPQDTLKVTRSALPDETQVVLLGSHGEAGG